MKNKIILLFALFLFSFKISGQINIDSISVFKKWLFIDMESCSKRYNSDKKYIEVRVIKTDSLFDEFNNIIHIKIKKLKSYSFPKNYIFYSLEIFDENNVFTNNLSYKRIINDIESDLYFIGQNNQGARQYVIALNELNGRSYRIQGFNNSDFLSFLNDFKKDYENQHFEKLKTKQFLKSFFVETLDFKCLYIGLSQEGTIDKYPCLKSCYAPTLVR